MSQSQSQVFLPTKKSKAAESRILSSKKVKRLTVVQSQVITNYCGVPNSARGTRDIKNTLGQVHGQRRVYGNQAQSLTRVSSKNRSTSFNDKIKTRNVNDKKNFMQTQNVNMQRQSSKSRITFGEKHQSMVVGASSSTSNLHAVNQRSKINQFIIHDERDVQDE